MKLPDKSPCYNVVTTQPKLRFKSVDRSSLIPFGNLPVFLEVNRNFDTCKIPYPVDEIARKESKSHQDTNELNNLSKVAWTALLSAVSRPGVMICQTVWMNDGEKWIKGLISSNLPMLLDPRWWIRLWILYFHKYFCWKRNIKRLSHKFQGTGVI